MTSKGLLIIAHGSKKKSSNDEFFSLVEKIKKENLDSYKIIKAAFLELCLPNIEESIEELVKNKISKIYFYPYFLNAGKHVSVDIPNIISELEEKYSDIEFEVFPHFGSSENVKDVVIKDIKI